MDETEAGGADELATPEAGRRALTPARYRCVCSHWPRAGFPFLSFGHVGTVERSRRLSCLAVVRRVGEFCFLGQQDGRVVDGGTPALPGPPPQPGARCC